MPQYSSFCFIYFLSWDIGIAITVTHLSFLIPFKIFHLMFCNVTTSLQYVDFFFFTLLEIGLLESEASSHQFKENSKSCPHFHYFLLLAVSFEVFKPFHCSLCLFISFRFPKICNIREVFLWLYLPIY